MFPKINLKLPQSRRGQVKLTRDTVPMTEAEARCQSLPCSRTAVMSAKKRWMDAVIAQSRKSQPDLPWHRGVRVAKAADRKVAAPSPRKAARA